MLWASLTNPTCFVQLNVGRSARNGIAFGVECLDSRVKRQDTASALENCELVSISVKGMALHETDLARMAQSIYASVCASALRSTPLFMDLLPESIEKIAPMFEVVKYGAGEAIFSMGDPCDKVRIQIYRTFWLHAARTPLDVNPLCAFTRSSLSSLMALWV